MYFNWIVIVSCLLLEWLLVMEIPSPSKHTGFACAPATTITANNPGAFITAAAYTTASAAATGTPTIRPL